jgi:hypothetical protein
MVLKLFSNPFLLKAFGNGARSQLASAEGTNVVEPRIEPEKVKIDRAIAPPEAPEIIFERFIFYNLLAIDVLIAIWCLAQTFDLVFGA